LDATAFKNEYACYVNYVNKDRISLKDSIRHKRNIL
jgi:hypothetical protein